VRVGEEVKLIIITRRDIAQGEEITVSYGDEGYWARQNEKGLWCGCGASECKWSEEAVRARAGEAASVNGQGEEGRETEEGSMG